MKKQIAFTFDDIPSYESLSDNPTAVIIKTLNDYGGKGTFFAVGSHIRKYGAAIPEQALKYGFELANHTDTHRNLTKLDARIIRPGASLRLSRETMSQLFSHSAMSLI